MRERRKTKINTIRNGKGTDLQRLKRWKIARGYYKQFDFYNLENRLNVHVPKKFNFSKLAQEEIENCKVL